MSYLGIAFRAALIFSVPNYSDDFDRFLRDGYLAVNGGDLLEFLPSEFNLEPGSFYSELYPNLNSKDYYTVYPPVLQFFFSIATYIGKGDLFTTMLVLKVIIVIVDSLVIYILHRLLEKFGKPIRWALIYALNPLVILELTGNIHFEGVMLLFSLIALWVLANPKGQWGYLRAAVPIAIAIGAKLLPVLFFPYLIRRLGWVKAILLGILSGVLVVGLFWLTFSPEFIDHYRESIRLYFKTFEFNANFYYLGRWALGDQGYRVNQILPYISMGLILFMALRQKTKVWSSLPLQMLMVLSIYQLLQPVIHPWYITTLVGFAALTRYRFPLVWTIFLPLTYLTYTNADYSTPLWVLWAEYIVLYLYIFFEVQFQAGAKTLEDWVREKPFLKSFFRRSIPARMKIKLDRIAAYLEEGDRVLDIGTGNGGLCRELRGRGYEVQPVDVKDISFFDDVKPLIYDGRKLPFKDGEFPVTMLITVLHHIPEPEQVLDEAIRVSGRRVIVMEDIYKNPFQKYLTFFTDSLVNLEFVGHPHTNKNDAGWRKTFADRGMKLVAREEFRTLVFFRQVIYVLEKE